MKKLINDPRIVVREMLEGQVGLHAGQTLLADENVVLRADLGLPAARQVAIISGGGSGHEPAHAGYVGAGMLHAAVAGDVFTSPSTDAVLAAIRAAAGPAGALLIVKNYTGDRLNFGLAAELARAEGIPVETVVVADDVALRDTVASERRRGLAGTVLVHKVAGAASAAGLDLAAVAAEARQAASAVGTMGVALGACTVPGGSAGFTLAADEMELGLGIHGEAGVRRTKLMPADQIVEHLLATILVDLAPPPGARVALLVNGLGGTPLMELAIVARKALAQLRAAGLHVARAWSGNLMTALEMPGERWCSTVPTADSVGRHGRAWRGCLTTWQRCYARRGAGLRAAADAASRSSAGQNSTAASPRRRDATARAPPRCQQRPPDRW